MSGIAPANPLALIIENSKLRSDLLAEKSLNIQLLGFRDHFDDAIGDRDARIESLEADLTAAAKEVSTETERNHELSKVVSELTEKLSKAHSSIASMKKDIDSRDVELSVKTVEILELKVSTELAVCDIKVQLVRRPSHRPFQARTDIPAVTRSEELTRLDLCHV